MIFTLRNIGKIERAIVELNGITVIAGENNTGKSTVGKALYALVNSCHNCYKAVHDKRIRNIKQSIGQMFISRKRDLFPANDILYCAEKYIKNPKLLSERIKEYIKISGARESDIDIEETTNTILAALKITDDEILKRIAYNYFRGEFSGQINNVFSNSVGCAELKRNTRITSVSFKDNMIEHVADIYDSDEEAIYIDDPFILDNAADSLIVFSSNDELNHREKLRTMIYKEKLDGGDIINNIIADNKLQNVYDIINRVCAGEIEESPTMGLAYKTANSEKSLDARNLSTGLKTFAIIKTLLKNGTLKSKSILILDEPEIHLHPQWQLLFAELIVLIQKEFNMRILLNTHSPYFLKAIEVYAAKYATADKCKYYLACTDNTLKDVTGHTEEIYKLLARPLQDLENVRYEND